MTEFISEEGHIFQAVVSGFADRHAGDDGRRGWASGSDVQYTFQKEAKAIQFVKSNFFLK